MSMHKTNPSVTSQQSKIRNSVYKDSKAQNDSFFD